MSSPPQPAVLEPGSAAWRRLVTPSKVAAILAFSPYASQYSMWHYMAGNIDIPETDAMRRGAFHEDAVLREFFYRHPELVRLPTGGITRRVTEWLAVTPDALAVDADGKLHMVEVKTSSDWTADGWGEPGTDEIPEHYYSQVVVAGHGVQADVIHVFVCGPFWIYEEYLVPPQPELAEASMAKLHQFWVSVGDGVPPELSHDLASYETWSKVADPALGKGAVDLPPELAAEYRATSAVEKAAKERLPALRAQIVNIMERAKANVAMCDGEKIARRQRNSAGGVSIVIVTNKSRETL